MLAVGTVLQNRYLIVHKIGQGGMGAVYEAKDQRLGVTVALKETIVNQEALHKAFEREAKLLAKLRHASLPVVSDYFFEADGQYLVMQYIDGKDLGELLSEKKIFPLVDVLNWTERLLDALDYLHSQNPPIIHRDIKPSNLKLTERGEIILLDFGLAKGNQSQGNTNASIYGYTPHYAPIEQIEGTGTDERSDIYALAATIYHLLTGVKPADAMPRVLSVLNGNSDPLRPACEISPQIPVAISEVLSRALSQKRDERPASAAQMKRELNDAIKKTQDPQLMTVLSAANKSNDKVQTSPSLQVKTIPFDENDNIATLVKASSNDLPETSIGTNPQPKAEQTQLVTRVNDTVQIPPDRLNNLPEKSSKLPFLVAIVSIFIFATAIVAGLFFLSKNKPSNFSASQALDISLASKDERKPTPLSAKMILGYGLNEPRYYEVLASAGEIKLILNVVANGATVTLEILDKDLKPLPNSTLSLSSLSNHNEQKNITFINSAKQKLILKLSNNYPKDLKAYRLEIDGNLELVASKEASDANKLSALAKEFEDRDNPTPLSSNQIVNRGSDKDFYYSFEAEAGEIKLALNVISNGSTVLINVFDESANLVQFSNNTTDFSLAAVAFHNEKTVTTINNTRKQKFLMRLTNNYSNDLKAYRLVLSGPIKYSKDKEKPAFASLLKEFNDRDNPIVLSNNEIIQRGNEKDLYYTFRVQPGELQFSLDLISNGSTLSIQAFDDQDKPIKFNNNSNEFSLAATADHHEKRNFLLINERSQSILMRISNSYPKDLKAYRLRLTGAIQIIKSDPNANKAFESLSKLFNDRDNPKPLTSNEISAQTGSEKDLYYTFVAEAGEIDLTLGLMADGSTINVEFFDKDNNPIAYIDKSTSFSVSSTSNKVAEKSITLLVKEKQNILMRITNTYPQSIKDYSIELIGDLELNQNNDLVPVP